MKQLLDKIEGNRTFIETERSKTVMDLRNMSEIKNWENKIKVQGTSLLKFYESWIKIHQSQKLKLLTKNEDIADYSLPSIKKLKKGKENGEESSEESDFDIRIKSDEEGRLEKRSKPKRRKLRANKDIKDKDIDLPMENTDIIRDIDNNDWD